MLCSYTLYLHFHNSLIWNSMKKWNSPDVAPSWQYQYAIFCLVSIYKEVLHQVLGVLTKSWNITAHHLVYHHEPFSPHFPIVMKKCPLNVGLTKTYFSAAWTMLEHVSALNSGSQVSRNCSNSFIIPRIFPELIRANESSIARLQKTDVCHVFMSKIL